MQNHDLTLRFKLKSDAIFGSAERSESGIDVDIQHDKWGCPYLPGRTLKGLLREQCADILDNLAVMKKQTDWEYPAVRLFGKPGSGAQDPAILHFRSAQLAPAVRNTLMEEVNDGTISEREVLNALTSLRKQTALDGWSGVAREKSLRVMRVILRNTTFEAQLAFQKEPEAIDLQLLAACLKAFRRCGSNRNRGTGELQDVQLIDAEGKDILPQHFEGFKNKVQGGTA